MNNVQRNALFKESDEGLLKAGVSKIDVAMATSVKRASDLTSDQSINVASSLFLFLSKHYLQFKMCWLCILYKEEKKD